MKKNKLTLLIASSFLALAALAGCGSKGEPSNASQSQESSQSSQVSSEDKSNSSSSGQSSNNSQSSSQGSQQSSQSSQSSQGGQSSQSSASSGGNSSSSSQGGQSSSSGGQQSSSSSGGGQSSSSGGSSSSSSGQGVKTDWTDAEKATMRAHLHGEVLPFVSLDVNVAYNEIMDAIYMSSTDNMESGFLNQYASLFVNWDGGDISNELGYYSGTIFYFEKAVYENNNKYYISVEFFGGEIPQGSEQLNYTPTGKFYLLARDPYLYSYPAQEVASMLQTRYGSTIVPPAFNAEYYYIDDDENYWVDGYSETNIETEYKTALLNTTNFSVEFNRDSNGYYVAHPNDGKYVLRFQYIESDKMMNIYFAEQKGWNSAVIANFFYNCGVLGYTVPAISDESIGFSTEAFTTVPGNEYLEITVSKVTTAMVQKYVNDLKALGYYLADDQVDDTGVEWNSQAEVLTDDGVYTIWLSYAPKASPKTLIITLNLYCDTSRVKSWPAAQVATVAQATQDIVPAFTGANRGFHFDEEQGSVTIYLAAGSETAAQTAYIELLEDASYRENGTTLGFPRYASQHNEINVSVGIDPQRAPGMMSLLIEPIKAVSWPTATIAQKLANHNMSVDTLPPLAIDFYEINYLENGEDYDVRIRCNVGPNEIDDAYDSYESTLQTNGFIPNDDTGLWTSPSFEYTVKLDNDGVSNFFIKVKAKYGEWSTAKLATMYQIIGATNDTIPEPYYGDNTPRARDYTFTWGMDASFNMIQRVVCQFLTANNASTSLATYLLDLSTIDGYEQIADDDVGHPHYKSQHEEIDVTAYINSDNTKQFYIDFVKYEAPAPSNGWEEASATIQQVVGENNVVPNLLLDNATHYSTVNSSRLYVQIDFPENTDLNEELVSLLANIGEQGFHYTPRLSGYVLVEEGDWSTLVTPTIADETTISVEIRRVDTSLSDYGIVMLSYDERNNPIHNWQCASSSDEELDYEYKVNYYSDDENELDKITLHEDEYLFVYDFTNEQSFPASIDDRSMNYEYDSYLEWHEDVGGFLVLQDFTAYFYLHIEMDADMIYVKDANPQLGGWDAAKAQLQAWLDDEITGYTIPDLQVSGADEYEAGVNWVFITIYDNSNYQGKYNELAASLASQGFHYSNFRQTFVKKLVEHTWLSVDVTISDEGLDITLFVEQYEIFVENNGEYSYAEYGLFYGYYNDEGEFGVDNYAPGVRINDDNGYKQYLVSDLSFDEGMVFFAYDFANEQGFNVSIDSYSLEQHYGDYFEYDPGTGGYIVKQDFVADVYIKLKYGSDMLYLDLQDAGY